MISIHPVALFLSWLALFVAGTFAMDFWLRLMAKRGVRTTYEPGCEVCGEEAACYINPDADCWDCVARKSQEQMERDQREHEEVIKRINLTAEQELAKIQLRMEEDLARADLEHQRDALEIEEQIAELQRREDEIEECHDEH